MLNVWGWVAEGRGGPWVTVDGGILGTCKQKQTRAALTDAIH